MTHPGTLVLIMAAAVLAPLLVHVTGRRVRVPLVIFEIALGIVIGPQVLGWARPDEVVDTLADLGLSMLIFLAGYEIEFAAVRETPCAGRCGPGRPHSCSVSVWGSCSAAARCSRRSSSVRP